MCQPWLTVTGWPVNALVGKAARKTATRATSSTVVNSPSTVLRSITSLMTRSSLIPRSRACSGICFSTRGVRTNPGQMMFERTPKAAPSLAKARAIPRPRPLAAPVTSAVFPCSRIGRRQYLLARRAETRYSFEVPIALAAKGVARSFRGFRALDGVDLSVEEGEIHAILGPNGAGKTTLFNCLSGVLQPTEGTVELFGEPITGLPPNQIVRKGLSRSFQISSVFESLTVLENIVVALQAPTPHPTRFWDSHTVLTKFHPRAREILAQVHLEGKEQVRAADLSHGQKRNLE